MAFERRDFLKFSAGSLLASVLGNIGAPERVRLASAMEVERFTKPMTPSRGTLYWDAQLMRVGSDTPLLRFKGAADGLLRWVAAPGEALAVDMEARRGFLKEFSIYGVITDRA